MTILQPPHLMIEPRALFRLLVTSAIALIITFLLFVLMHKLIESNHAIQQEVETTVITDFIFDRQDSPIERTASLPPQKAMSKPSKVPPLKTEPSENSEIDTHIPQFSPPKLVTTSLSTFTPPDGDARPIVRMEPKYPVAAARDGIEGWVRLKFNITAAGKVEDVKVVEAEPKRIFDIAAKRALRKWKYEPKKIDGKAVPQMGISVILSFDLDS